MIVPELDPETRVRCLEYIRERENWHADTAELRGDPRVVRRARYRALGDAVERYGRRVLQDALELEAKDTHARATANIRYLLGNDGGTETWP